ncbi:MAG: DUF1254 domain-containing protein [Novosphingobium sp.]
MNRKLKLLGLFVGAGILGHVGLVMAVPHAIMRVAMSRMSGDSAMVNQFKFGPRTTKDSRGVVRPSPDLAYSSCVYDLSKGPLLVSAAPSPNQGYVSLSVFAANTDNIAALDTAQFPDGIRFVLARKGQAVPAGMQVVESPSDKGIILDRRLAPSAEMFAQVDQVRRADSCAPLAS